MGLHKIEMQFQIRNSMTASKVMWLADMPAILKLNRINTIDSFAALPHDAWASNRSGRKYL